MVCQLFEGIKYSLETLSQLFVINTELEIYEKMVCQLFEDIKYSLETLSQLFVIIQGVQKKNGTL